MDVFFIGGLFMLFAQAIFSYAAIVGAISIEKYTELVIQMIEYAAYYLVGFSLLWLYPLYSPFLEVAFEYIKDQRKIRTEKQVY